MCGALIASLINRYLDDNATINAISSRLREICPSLYSQDDAICSKVIMLLVCGVFCSTLVLCYAGAILRPSCFVLNIVLINTRNMLPVIQNLIMFVLKACLFLYR